MSIKRKRKLSCTLFRILAVASLCSSIINLTLLAICLTADRWIFGDLLCQILAFVSHVLVAGAAWLVALAGLERYFKLVLPADHPCVFSDINTKLLVVGLYLLVAIILINPLYGWGEYSEYRGYFQLTVYTLRPNMTNVTPEGLFTNVTTQSSIASDLGQIGCGYQSNISSDFWFPGNINTTQLVNIFTGGFKQNWNIFSRVLLATPNSLVFALRAPNRENLDNLLEQNKDKSLGESLFKNVAQCSNDEYMMCLKFYMNHKEIETYKNIFVPFQVTNMCTVDFTTMNKGAWGWIAFFIASTGAAPYTMIAVCAILTFRKWSRIKWEHRAQDIEQSRKFFYGCALSVPLYFPYFIVNLSNYYGNYVSPALNVFVMILYYGSNLLPCVLLSPKYMCRSIERSSTTASIRESETEDQEEFEMEIIPDHQL